MAQILIADDDYAYLSSFANGLEAFGHSVTGVNRADRVLPKLMDKHFDIVFLDVIMNGGGAITYLHKLRESHPDLPIVVISGMLDLVDSPLYTLGMRRANARLHKSISLEDLNAVITELTHD